ncbi:hypothetical protein BGW36DRAFT_460756 [Talaromyces proteolyticus]|uniref:Uncharacterized protein n=1 Tax=Talaromyces proteolyticus TaxID=1131652 RepID=A0AAD4Q1W4_9EURO|nr:uncharacterized protein BGW36DRAFT_460756 [Talaromyces proteolyticus]KAH8698940.1 hypothetical protein BGW36DRAFT_460756 [Talaromyces proteolyticus]
MVDNQYNSSVQLANTASQRALSLPEIVSEVLYWIHIDENISESDFKKDVPQEYIEPESFDDPIPPSPTYSYGKFGVLFRCCLVNRLWYQEAVPLMWETIEGWFWDPLLPICFEGIFHHSRRQFYANFIKRLVLQTINQQTAQRYDLLLRGLVFPKLEWLRLYLRGNIWEKYGVPPVDGPNLKTMELDPHFENDITGTDYLTSQDDWENVFEQVPIQFPALENVRIIDRARVWPGALERFEKRLPHLKKFDKRLVIESSNTTSE